MAVEMEIRSKIHTCCIHTQIMSMEYGGELEMYLMNVIQPVTRLDKVCNFPLWVCRSMLLSSPR